MARKKITELTPAQQARLKEFADEWTAIGLSTEPADRPRAEAGIRKAYEIAGLPAPRVVWCGSPLSGAITRSVVISDKFAAQIKGIVENADLAGDSVGDSVRDSVGDSVRDSVGASVWDSVWASVRDSVWASVEASVWDSVWASVWAAGYGQHDANWLGFYEYFQKVCDLKDETDKLAGLWEVARSSGWFWPHRNVVWMCERHKAVSKNAAGQLHGDMRPAVSFPDGWAIYALNGVRVPKWLAMSHPDDLDARKILAVENVDQRREGIRRVGSERLVAQLDAKTLDRRGEYQLLAVEMGVGAPWHYLKMKNPSLEDTYHVEAVPREADTVEKAINWRRYRDVNKRWKPQQLT